MSIMHVSKYTAEQIDEAIDKMLRKPQSNTCQNCGAPLNQYGGCDYCGTGKQSDGKMLQPQEVFQTQKSESPMCDGEALLYFCGKRLRGHITHVRTEQMYDGAWSEFRVKVYHPYD